jgi:hypothetical protein
MGVHRNREICEVNMQFFKSDDRNGDEAGDPGDTVWGRIDADIEEFGTPTMTALLRRINPFTKTPETMWVNAYPEARLIVETCPPIATAPGRQVVGTVRTIPVARNVYAADRFGSVVAWRLAHGWQSVPATVWSGDPWDATSTLDKPAEF